MLLSLGPSAREKSGVNRSFCQDSTPATVQEQQNARRRPGESGASLSRRAPSYDFHVVTAGRLTDPRSSGKSSCGGDPDASWWPQRTIGRGSGGGPRNYDVVGRLDSKPRHCSSSSCDRGSERAQGQAAVFAGAHGRAGQELTGESVVGAVRHRPPKSTLHSGGREDAGPACCRDPGGFHLPAELGATISPSSRPVSVIGTFLGMQAARFLDQICSRWFGLVLAIGIVVDDAIVVIENVDGHGERKVVSHAGVGGSGPGACRQVRRALIAIVSGCCSVCRPVDLP